MAFQSKRVVSILLEECHNVEERYAKYPEHVRDLVSEIMNLERRHRLARTTIQKQVADAIDAAGQVLDRQTNGR